MFNLDKGFPQSRIVLAGDSLGQLAAAVGLAQRGFEVEFREPPANEYHVLRWIHLTPSAITFLDSLGVDIQDVACVVGKIIIQSQDGGAIESVGASDLKGLYHHAWSVTPTSLLRKALWSCLIAHQQNISISNQRDKYVASQEATIVLDQGTTACPKLARSKIVDCQPEDLPSDFQSGVDISEYGIRLDVWRGEGLEASRLVQGDSTLSWTYAGEGDSQDLSHLLRRLDISADAANLKAHTAGNRLGRQTTDSSDAAGATTSAGARCVLFPLEACYESSLASYTIDAAMRHAAAFVAIMSEEVTQASISDRLECLKHFHETYSARALPRTLADLLSLCRDNQYESAAQALRHQQWRSNPTTYWRQPIEFGPMPGPRQMFNGDPHQVQHSTFTAATIRFTSDHTALANLLPMQAGGSLRLPAPGSKVEGSFTQTTFRNLDWLGGRGYRLLSMLIHGIEHDGGGGKKVIRGNYVPVLFETLADPILSGREELGMPKVYSAIDVLEEDDENLEAITSWEGTVWGEFRWHSLTQVFDFKPPPPTDGLICYRYQPRIGLHEKGIAEVSHPVLIPAHDPSCQPKITRVRRAARASFQLHPRCWKELPTLHHIISRLALLPNYGIVDAYVIDGEGIPDARTTSKLASGHTGDDNVYR